jgi:two-component system sensor histidine kinase TctE
MASGLRNRLLLLLLLPLLLFTAVNLWIDYRLADSAAVQHDLQLQRFMPMLADSLVAPGAQPGDAPVLLLAPPIEDFLKNRPGVAGYSINTLDGQVLLGEPWLTSPAIRTHAPEFRSAEEQGVTFRIVSQRVSSRAGELIVQLADGSDPRLQWRSTLLLRVLLPNGLLMVALTLAVNWAVRRALRPLTDLTEAVDKRSPRDLRPIDLNASPDEARPLVQALNRLLQLVQVQADSQRRFVADAAHQLRTPLAGLQAQVEAWAQLLHSRSQATPAGLTLSADQIYKLRGATRRTTQLANQLLALSRADARGMETQPMQRVDLQSLCESILEQHLDAAMAQGLDLGLEAQPTHVSGHEWLLRELLSNLVDNAIKYTPRGGSVTLRCGRAGAGAEARAFLAVEDDGPGIAWTERARVLERFYRVPGTVGEGSGLGLAIADEIARLHGGQLDLGAGAQGRGLLVSLSFAA